MRARRAGLYRVLLLAFPQRFRDRYAEDMVDRFLEQRRKLRSPSVRLVGWWMALVLDALRHGLALRLSDAWRRVRRTAPALPRFESIIRETRQGLRVCLQDPFQSFTVVLTGTIAMALSGTVFAVVDGVLFRPLPYPQAANLFVASADSADGTGGYMLTLSELDAWRHAFPSLGFSALRAARTAGTLGDGKSYTGVSVDEAFFETLGQTPARGVFARANFEGGAPLVAIISHRLWQRAFGGQDAIGRELPLAGGRDHLGRPIASPVVVGILPANFTFPAVTTPDVITPLVASATERADRNESAIQVLIRVPAGTTAEAWATSLSALTRSLQPSGPPDGLVVSGVHLESVTHLGRPFVARFWALAAATACLLLLSFVGLSSLTTARLLRRERQTFLRRALGASSWDLCRHTLAEIAPLFLVAATLGLVAVRPLLAFTVDLLPASTPFLKTPQLDVRVLIFAAMVASCSMVIVVGTSLRAMGRIGVTSWTMTAVSRRRRRAHGLVLVQTALAFVITLAGGLMTVSLWRAWHVNPGYERDRIVVVRATSSARDAAEGARDAQSVQQMLSRVSGVESAVLVTSPFLAHASSVVGAKTTAQGKSIDLSASTFQGDFFGVLGVHPVEGRLPGRDEIERGDPVIVLSEHAASALWRDADAIGRTVVLGGRTQTVIGVVRDLKLSGLTDRDRRAGQVFMYGQGGRDFSVLLRTRDAPQGVASEAARLTAGLRPRITMLSASTIGDALGDSISDRRFSARLYGGYAVSALTITGIGILGLVAMLVESRTKEIGIRIALGARRSGIVLLVWREQMLALGAGIAIGAVAAFWAVELLRRQLYELAPTDSSLWIVAAIVTLAAGSLATAVPTAWASRADPMSALRADD